MICFNSTIQCKNLHLTYRFKWYMITRAVAEEAGKVMTNEERRSAEWWDNLCRRKQYRRSYVRTLINLPNLRPAARFSFPVVGKRFTASLFVKCIISYMSLSQQ